MRLCLAALLVGRARRAGSKVHELLVHDAHAGVRSAAVSVLLGLAACGLGGRAPRLALSNLLLGCDAGLVVVVFSGAVDDLAALLAALGLAALLEPAEIKILTLRFSARGFGAFPCRHSRGTTHKRLIGRAGRG